MASINQPPAWSTNSNLVLCPVFYEGKVVGYCRPEFAQRIVETLNEDEKLRKALKMACFDLLNEAGGDPSQVHRLMHKYIERSQRPKHGPGAIAALLRDRQEELDVSDSEFAFFCDSYRLPRQELLAIYNGKEVTNHQLGPLSRILGITPEEIVAIRDGKNS